MIKLGWIFPGQASQYVGMGKDLYESTTLGKSYFKLANDILGFDLKTIIFDGPEEKLKRTEYTQPAIFLISSILSKLLQEKLGDPVVSAGHSLGEYSALLTANAFSFEEGMQLIKVRSSAMKEACEQTRGTMAAIIGFDILKLQKLCSEYKGRGKVVIANYNSPHQIIISGSIKAVRYILEESKFLGAKLTKEINVGGAFHSPLMKSATESLAEKVNSTQISNLKYPVISNFDGKPNKESSKIKYSLIKQIESPVLWYQSIKEMRAYKVDKFIEVGPGNILQGLNKRIVKEIPCIGISSISDLTNFNV